MARVSSFTSYLISLASFIPDFIFFRLSGEPDFSCYWKITLQWDKWNRAVDGRKTCLAELKLSSLSSSPAIPKEPDQCHPWTMNDFDYDEALLTLERERESKQGLTFPCRINGFASKNPGVNVPVGLADLILLPPFSVEEPTIRYGFADLSELEDKHAARWTVPDRPEVDCVVEFPVSPKGTESARFRLRKHLWVPSDQAVEDGTDPNSGPGYLPAVTKEISALRLLRKHENIVLFLDAFVAAPPGDSCVLLVFGNWDFTLEDCLTNEARGSEQHSGLIAVPVIVKQILQGLRHVHSRRIVHRNLTAASVKATAAGHIRLGDFMYAVPADVSLRATRNWQEDFPALLPDGKDHLAPEILCGSDSYGTTSDMWSLGILLFRLYTGNPLFKADRRESKSPGLSLPASSADALAAVVNVFGTPTEVEFPGLWKLPRQPSHVCRLPGYFKTGRLSLLSASVSGVLEQLLVYNEKHRPSARDVEDNLEMTEDRHNKLVK